MMGLECYKKLLQTESSDNEAHRFVANGGGYSDTYQIFGF